MSTEEGSPPVDESTAEVDHRAGQELPVPVDHVDASTTAPTGIAARAFGTDNRARLLRDYFDAEPAPQADDAWKHVYRLLLWADRTTGLAHCYESDKCQPGRPWYARSLAFHTWVANALAVPPGHLGEHIDVLFRRATSDLAATAAATRAARRGAADTQRAPYAGQDLPQPGEDVELEQIVIEVLGRYLVSQPPQEVLRHLTERISVHIGQENKRKNLVGEGFEDTLAEILRRLPAVAESHEIYVRPYLQTLPGFRPPRSGSKPRQVDLALVHRTSSRRTLVSCKWSVRSDREEQFASDFRDYAELEDAGEDFGYVLVTNEFDPARLAAACDMRRQNAPLFTAVVHVNPDGPRAAYAAPGLPARTTGGQIRVLERITSGHLTGLTAWLQGLQE